jgi:hypothetical protein
MKNKTCGECKHRYSYHHDEDCNGRCELSIMYRIPSNKPACSEFEPIPPQTVFDHITESPDVLANTLVYCVEPERFCECADWRSVILGNVSFTTRSAAFDATMEKLKEMCDE